MKTDVKVERCSFMTKQQPDKLKNIYIHKYSLESKESPTADTLRKSGTQSSPAWGALLSQGLSEDGSVTILPPFFGWAGMYLETLF